MDVELVNYLLLTRVALLYRQFLQFSFNAIWQLRLCCATRSELLFQMVYKCFIWQKMLLLSRLLGLKYTARTCRSTRKLHSVPINVPNLTLLYRWGREKLSPVHMMNVSRQVLRLTDTYVSPSAQHRPQQNLSSPAQSGPAQSTWQMALLMEADRLSN